MAEEVVNDRQHLFVLPMGYRGEARHTFAVSVDVLALAAGVIAVLNTAAETDDVEPVFLEVDCLAAMLEMMKPRCGVFRVGREKIFGTLRHPFEVELGVVYDCETFRGVSLAPIHETGVLNLGRRAENTLIDTSALTNDLQSETVFATTPRIGHALACGLFSDV